MTATSDLAQRQTDRSFSTGPCYWSLLAAVARVLRRVMRALFAVV